MQNGSSNFKNPLQEDTRSLRVAEPCILVIFGATGDLTGRKLLPALYNLAREGQLPVHFVCVGFARREKSNEQFRQEMLEDVNKYSRVKPADQEIWKSFSEALFYHRSEFDNDSGYETLRDLLRELDNRYGTKGNRLFYLSSQPSFFPLIIQKLKQHNLIYDVNVVHDKWSRVIIEKPFGEDFQSAIELQNDITQHLAESQIFRIDHYLGKETVQNLLVFRFSNPIFESIWNNHHVDHVQLTVSEDIGVGTRGRFWEEAGMLRDIVQNHMMQLLSLVAMEPPINLQASSIHDEKVKVMESIRAFDLSHIDQQVVRGQYGPGYIKGNPVVGYRSESNVSPNSFVETYLAMELFIDNWRWSGVPFYLRAGKRLPKRTTEIAVFFHEAPRYLFKIDKKRNEQNTLVIRIQPDEGISFKINCKVPAMSAQIQPVKMDFRYGTYFGSTPPEAYERLIWDCMAGDSTLFARNDEVMASWKLLTPVLEHWKEVQPIDFPNYPSGSWGPQSADELLTRTGRSWRLL